MCGPRRRPEHLHLVGPLGDPMFVGSPTVVAHSGGCGGGGGGGEGNTGPETVSRVLIPNCKIGAVIGKGGAIIKHIREVRGGVSCLLQVCAQSVESIVSMSLILFFFDLSVRCV